MKSSDFLSRADNVCDNHAMGQESIDHISISLRRVLLPNLRERNYRQHRFDLRPHENFLNLLKCSPSVNFFFFFFFLFFTVDAKRDEVDTTKSERGYFRDVGERRGRKDGSRRTRFEAEERRDRDWRCEHWMLIREGFNVEPVASSPPRPPDSLNSRVDAAIRPPFSPLCFPLRPARACAAIDSACSRRSTGPRRCSSLRNAARKSSSCSTILSVGDRIRRAREPNATLPNSPILRFTFPNPFLFSLASLFSFLFWYIIVGGKTVLHLIGIISST